MLVVREGRGERGIIRVRKIVIPAESLIGCNPPVI